MRAHARKHYDHFYNYNFYNFAKHYEGYFHNVIFCKQKRYYHNGLSNFKKKQALNTIFQFNAKQ